MPAIQEIYDKTIEGYTVDNDWLYYMDKDETTKHYIPYVYREVSIVFYQDFKTLMAKTDLYSQIIWNDDRCAFTIFETTFILACIESINYYNRTYENRNKYQNGSRCITPIIFQDYQEHKQCYLNLNTTSERINKNDILDNTDSYMEILSAGLVNRFYNNNRRSYNTVPFNINSVISGVMLGQGQYEGYQLHTKAASSIRNGTGVSKNFKYGIVVHYNTNFLHIAYKPSYQFNLNGMSYYLSDKMPLIFICKGVNKLTNEPILYITADPNSSIKTNLPNANNIDCNVQFGTGINQNLLMPIYNHWRYQYKYSITDTDGIIYSYIANSGYDKGKTEYAYKINSSDALSVIHNLYNPKTKEHLDPYNVNPYFVFDLLPGHEKFISGFINREASQIYLQKLQTYFGWIEFDNVFNVQESPDLYYQDAYYTINGETYYKSSNNFIGLQKHQTKVPIFLLKI